MLTDIIQHDLNCDILTIQETWLQDHIIDEEVCIKDYAIFRADRNHTKMHRGGGTAIYVNKNYCDDPKEILSVSNDHIDIVAVDVNGKFIVASTYINQAYNMQSAIDIILDELIYKSGMKYKIFLCGDFNNAPVSTAFELNSLRNIVSFPTRENAYLDQIWTNVQSNLLDVVKCSMLADHSVILMKDKYSKYDRPRRWVNKIIKKLNNERMQAELECTDWVIFNNIDNLEEKTEAITSYINFCEHLCTETVVYHEDEITGETTNSTIKYFRRKRERAFKDNNDAMFKFYSQVVEQEIAKLNGELLTKFRQENSKNYWKHVKTFCGKSDNNQTHYAENINVNMLN
ncbi:Uncharacterised protein at_DN2132 [Pycnogonum litorale]